MIERIEGEFLEVGPGHILVNMGGLGVRVHVPRTVAERLEGYARGVLWTRLLIRDGDPLLYGFLEPEERLCFDALLGVSGVGPRIALAILSFMAPGVLFLEAERGSVEQLMLVPGVGRKLASRIVLELKGKIPASMLQIQAPTPDAATAGDLSLDALRALTALGYPAVEAREAVRRFLQSRGEGGAAPILDEIVRGALRGLSGRVG
ncbi:MAG: Holliday junction branch migration protein RuvA [Candidatus Eisenbacteria bacterium]|nr:Holliday junction branch migration protein RuvA [Candidatus Eisenbacteria bacterium]